MIDWTALRELDPDEPWRWPAGPKRLLLLALTVVAITVLWLTWLQGARAALHTAQATEAQLKDEVVAKLRAAQRQATLQAAHTQITGQVSELQQLLANKAEVDDLLAQIQQAAQRRGVQFESVRAGQSAPRAWYVETPWLLRFTGGYHEMGALVADLAQLPRAVVLEPLTLAAAPQRSGALLMEASALFFRSPEPPPVTTPTAATAPKRKPNEPKPAAQPQPAAGARP